MLKRFILCIYFFLAALSVFSQEEGVFWKISGKDLRSSSYLFGTIHLMCEDDFQISQQVSKRLELAEALVMEVDLDDPDLYGSMMENMYNEEGQKITDFLSENEYEKIRDFLKERTGMDMDRMQSIRPMVLMSLIYPNLLECETMAFESELMQLAKAENISVLGLESVDEQLAFFEQIPLKEQYRSFFNYTENLEKGKEEFRKLMSSYREEDIAQLLELVTESPEYKDYKGILVDQRNENWIDTMGSMMQKGTMFFAVGAGHLAGEKGLIHLLKKEGYFLERVYL
ncbi:TraB/GumN family protein [Cyclobacterium jeungdonense]|uniref:TraB/GumN family protein n=1 Tax=Cyclobacterium jeungdonense TaxID=708087 RepID=A0ABT8C1W5_9BACT|nr:TraB/GumN family protein [Cyclobacterium jeungdonense]MDN3686785.1 TraB/GumN family protein [Cyclobacterium jeungdonense]